jgi:ADP-heptose:LPS heptosyltransferase
VKILAIRFARLGDVVLLLPALSLLKRSFHDARLTLLTGHRCAPIADLCPAIDDVIEVNRIAMRDGPVLSAFRDMARLVSEVRRRRFDLVIDFHSFRETNLLAWSSGAPVRIGLKRHGAPYLNFCFNRPPILEDKALHVGEMFERVVECAVGAVCDVELRGQTAPAVQRLVIPTELRHWADRIEPGRPKLVLFIDAPVSERIWPPERFAVVADYAVQKMGANPIVITSSEGEGLVRRFRNATENPDRIGFFTNVSLPRLAALIASARVFVSNDTGPMHIGPSAGIPTLGLFSVGYPEHFRPAGPKGRFLRGNPIEKIRTEDVIAVVEEMWTIAGPDLRC